MPVSPLAERTRCTVRYMLCCAAHSLVRRLQKVVFLERCALRRWLHEYHALRHATAAEREAERRSYLDVVDGRIR